VNYTDDIPFGLNGDGVMVLSGDRVAVHVEKDMLKITSDGCEVSYPRGDCPLRSIVVSRDRGYVSFAAVHWLYDRKVSLSQVGLTGEPILTTTPASIDRPRTRRAQAMAASAPIGNALTRELLIAKVRGQATVLRMMEAEPAPAEAGASLLEKYAGELAGTIDQAAMLQIEALAAVAYWRCWRDIPLRFARQTTVPAHWKWFGLRKSTLSLQPYRAVSPGNSLLNYCYALAVSEMCVALAGVGLDPGLGVFHTDAENRQSFAYDCVEAVRPTVDLYLWRWLQITNFAKRDFYELADGAFRVTRPLTSHLALVKPLWKDAFEAVAGWAARSLERGTVAELHLPMRDYHIRRCSSRPFPANSCFECGKMLHGEQRRFCSLTCSKDYQNSQPRDGRVISDDEQRRRIYGAAKAAGMRVLWETLTRISHRAAADVGFSDVSGCLSGFWGREPGVLSLSGRG
jgi:CRISPR-associated endonuclease Cas1